MPNGSKYEAVMPGTSPHSNRPPSIRSDAPREKRKQPVEILFDLALARRRRLVIGRRGHVGEGVGLAGGESEIALFVMPPAASHAERGRAKDRPQIIPP